MDNLRLQIAQFNNFIIENYIADQSEAELPVEPHQYIFDALFKLSATLGIFGQLIGSIDYIYQEDISQYNQALIDSSIDIYLIEISTDQKDLFQKLDSIVTDRLQHTLNNILAYGKQFDKDQSHIDQEVEEFKKDNFEYFNTDGNFKYTAYQPIWGEAITYLANNSPIPQVKNSFKQLKSINCFLTNTASTQPDGTIDFSNNKTFLKNLLISLTTILMAFSYLEPFFEKSDTLVNDFETFITEISASQAILLEAC